jgi:hypothetical protein
MTFALYFAHQQGAEKASARRLLKNAQIQGARNLEERGVTEVQGSGYKVQGLFNTSFFPLYLGPYTLHLFSSVRRNDAR